MTLSYQFPVHPPRPIQPGDLIITWCSRCMVGTAHRYEPLGKAKLVCVECEKENAK